MLIAFVRASSPARADVSMIHVRSIGIRCLDGGTSVAHVELRADADGQTFADSIGLACYDYFGHRKFDLPRVFRTMAGQSWDQGRSWLFAVAGFPAATGLVPDLAWHEVGQVAADAAGTVRFEDVAVAPEHRYAYRLTWTGAGGAAVTAGEVSVLVPPAYRFALSGARPNPTAGPLVVAFELPREGEAALELLDVAGRRVLARSVHLGAGDHTLELRDDGAVRPGFYLLRLRFGAESATRRVIVTR